MVSEELAFVALAGRAVSYTHAVLIETANGWHVEIEGVPGDSCPLVESECEISFDTWDGDHYAGSVGASYASQDPIYLVLTGRGELRRTCAADATVREAGDARTSA